MDLVNPSGERGGLQAFADFAEHLEAFAAGLSARERQLLMSIITQAMDPLSRVQAHASVAPFSTDEEALLRDLAKEPPPG